jgi:ankyrin repeat protein
LVCADTLLHAAAGNGHEGVVELLLGAGANIEIKNSKSQTPLEMTVQNFTAAAGRRLKQ